ncbi:MAG: hypothetical protein AAGA60_27975 [Cyanobacteria bacterium P01_E01_bin.42]
MSETSDALKRAQKRYRQKPEVKARDAERKRLKRQTTEGQEYNRNYEQRSDRREYKTQKAREYRAKSRPVPYHELQKKLRELGSEIALNSSYDVLAEEVKKCDRDWWDSAIAQQS